MTIPEGARCPKGKLHDLIITFNRADAQKEVCRFCGVRRIYRKHPKTGRYDGRRYLADHLRDTVQPWGRTRKLFARTYGWGEVKKLLRQASRQRRGIKDIWEETRDIVKTARRLTVDRPGFRSGRFKSGQLLPM